MGGAAYANQSFSGCLFFLRLVSRTSAILFAATKVFVRVVGKRRNPILRLVGRYGSHKGKNDCGAGAGCQWD
jgi:hypothetical protein